MFDHYFAWKNNPLRQTLYKRACRIVARGKTMNSILIQFEDGTKHVVSRNAVRKIQVADRPPVHG